MGWLPIAAAIYPPALVIAQVADVGSDTWANTGIMTLMVGAIVYLVKQFAAGKLVAREPAETEKALLAALTEMGDINAQLHEIAQEAHEINRVLLKRLPNP